MEPTLIYILSTLIDETTKEGITKKIDLSKKAIMALYLYLRQLGLSDDEIGEIVTADMKNGSELVTEEE